MSNWKEHISKPNKVFYCAFHSLKANSEKEICFKNLHEYFINLSIKEKKEVWIFDFLFKTEWEKKEEKNLAIAYIIAAKISLERILKFNPKIDNPVIVELLMNFICDFKYWINIIDQQQDFSWLLSNTRDTISKFYYDAVRFTLYGDKKSEFRNSDARFISATLLIRHTIEQRIKGILGIDFILDNRNRPVGLSEIIKIVSGLNLLKQRKEIDFNRILKINGWANDFLHRGLRPLPWQLEWAEYELNKWFYNGQTLNKQYASIYASFETENLQNLRQEFESKLSKIKPDFSIVWCQDGEIHDEFRYKKLR